MKPYDKKQFGKSYWNCKCKYCGNPKAERRADKSAARQLSKKQTKKELEENTISRQDFERASSEYGYEAIEQYNSSILYGFVDTLRAIAPELGWADSDDTWGYDDTYYGRRGLSAVVYKYRKWTPATSEEYSSLIEKIYRESK